MKNIPKLFTNINILKILKLGKIESEFKENQKRDRQSGLIEPLLFLLYVDELVTSIPDSFADDKLL